MILRRYKYNFQRDCILMIPFLCTALVTCGKEHELIRLDGDIILGGLFPMHENSLIPHQTCGAVKREKGIQRMEAMLYALDEINSDPSILPNITLGALILDTCSSDTYALEQSMEFIRTSINQDSSQYICEDGKQPKLQPRKPVSGVIGASFSGVSVMVANILRLFKIPQISYASTSIELSDKTRFEYFSRVVPPDNFQAQALVELVKKLGWKYVSTIAVEGEYGEKGIESFTQKAQQVGICIAISSKISRNAKAEDFDSIIHKISEKRRAIGVVIFVDEDNIRKLLSATVRSKNISKLLWIGSDSWGAKIHPVKDFETVAEGAITILPKRRPILGFDKYFQSLKPKPNPDYCKGDKQNKVINLKRKNSFNRINCRNIWFEEFWEANFNCTFFGGNGKKICIGNENLTNYSQEGLVPFVVDAVYAMAKALHNIGNDLCRNEHYDTCYALYPIPSGSTLLRYIRNVSFVGMQQQEVKFNEDGDPIASYDFFQYQKVGSKYDYVLIGEWGKRLTLYANKMKWRENEFDIPTSACSDPCPMGHIRNFLDHCCWKCVACREDSYIFNDTCFPCKIGWIPTKDKMKCYKLEANVISWESPWALIPIIFSSIGLLFTIFTTLVFVYYSSTPVVMASGKELCYILLLGIGLCYIMTFSILAKPTVISCGSVRVGLGLCISICYSAILVKSYRIFRIFDRSMKGVKCPSYTSPKSQVIICFSIISLQLVGTIAWLIIEPPSVKEAHPSRSITVLMCGISTLSLIISLVYNMMLILLCTLYAFKTRKIPENFNEAKYVGFTMYSTCIIWLAYVPIYFSTKNDYKIQQSSTCICVSLSATVALVCLFLPKLYVVLFHPHKNVRQTGIQISNSLSGVQRKMRFVKSNTILVDLNSAPCSFVPDILGLESGQAEQPDKNHSMTPSNQNSAMHE